MGGESYFTRNRVGRAGGAAASVRSRTCAAGAGARKRVAVAASGEEARLLSEPLHLLARRGQVVPGLDRQESTAAIDLEVRARNELRRLPDEALELHDFELSVFERKIFGGDRPFDLLAHREPRERQRLVDR